MTALVVVPKRRLSFLDTSLRLDGITEIVTLCKGSKYFTELRMASQIKFKKSFLKYVRYCVDQGFISKFEVSYKNLPDRYIGLKLSASHYTFYQTTSRGKQFLELTQ